jgi:hypothetical protein
MLVSIRPAGILLHLLLAGMLVRHVMADRASGRCTEQAVPTTDVVTGNTPDYRAFDTAFSVCGWRGQSQCEDHRGRRHDFGH